MDVKTIFNVGDTVSVVDVNEVIDFEIKAIIIDKESIHYRGDNYKTYEENICFSTRQELLDYILGNTKDNKKTEEK